MTSPDPPVENLRIAMIGTRGVPARYGGFETCVEEVGWRLADKGTRSSCTAGGSRRVPTMPRPRTSACGWSTCPRCAVSRWRRSATPRCRLRHLLRHRTDAAIVFNSANAPLPAARCAPPDPGRHPRGRPGVAARQVGAGRTAVLPDRRTLAVRWSDALIADATGIQDYYRTKFVAPTPS